MKDFNSYIPNEQPKKSPDMSDIDTENAQSAMDMVKNIAQKYHGKSEAEMLSAIFKEAEKGRESGSLTDGELDKFASTISPFIDKNKREKLKEIIDKLKKT